MLLQKLQINDFRNYTSAIIEFPAEGAVLEGLNGSGKTNLLESIHLLCTGRSQRLSSRSSMIRFTAQCAYLEGHFTQAISPTITEASLGFCRDGNISMRLNGSTVHSFGEWFGKRSVISFGPDDLRLISGPPEGRRRFLDLLASQIDRKYLDSLLHYRRIMLQRNKLLSTGRFDKVQMEIYEDQMSESGTELMIYREKLISELNCFIKEYYREISAGSECAEIVYSSAISCDCSRKNEWKNVFFSLLNERRNKDIEYGFSSIGPHRDDIDFLLNKKPAKTFGSQGQCRSLALSLKLSAVRSIENYRSDPMIFLVDDATSELDSQRGGRIYPLIENRGQVFIAVPKLETPLRGNLLHCAVSEGAISIV